MNYWQFSVLINFIKLKKPLTRKSCNPETKIVTYDLDGLYIRLDRLLMRYIPLLLLTVIFSCQKKQRVHQNAFIVDIPVWFDYDNRPYIDVMYKYTQEKAQKLKLEPLQNGFKGITIRVWAGGGIFANERLLILKYTNNEWTAKSYAMIVDTVIVYRTEQLVPESGWKNFITSLMKYQIMTLPDGKNVPEIRRFMDGESGDAGFISIEVATKSMYRFYSFGPPNSSYCNCWQGRNMDSILKVINRAFPQRHSSTDARYMEPILLQYPKWSHFDN